MKHTKHTIFDFKIFRLVCLLVLVALGSYAGETNSPPPAPVVPPRPRVELERVFGSQENLQVVLHPTSVYAYRIDPRSLAWTAKDLENVDTTNAPPVKAKSSADRKAEIAGYHIIGRPVQLETNTVQQLASLWSHPESFSSKVTLCDFSPGIALKYERGNKVVILLICLTCTEVGTFVDGKMTGGAKLFPIGNQINVLVHQMFPHDKDLPKVE